MQTHEYETMRSVEDTYWWYRVLRGLVVRALAARVPADAAILDAGCGTGGMMAAMRDAQPRWRLTGMDWSPQAVELTKARGFDHVRLGRVDEPLAEPGSFDAVVSLDVICSRGVDREKAVESFHGALKPGGVLVMNLPAFECLRGSHDVAVAVEKRFTRGEVTTLLEDGGFEVKSVRCWNAWLFPPILVWRYISRLFLTTNDARVASDLQPLPGVLNDALTAIGRMDATLGCALHLPFGTSVFSVATKRKTG